MPSKMIHRAIQTQSKRNQFHNLLNIQSGKIVYLTFSYLKCHLPWWKLTLIICHAFMVHQEEISHCIIFRISRQSWCRELMMQSRSALEHLRTNASCLICTAEKAGRLQKEKRNCNFFGTQLKFKSSDIRIVASWNLLNQLDRGEGPKFHYADFCVEDDGDQEVKMYCRIFKDVFLKILKDAESRFHWQLVCWTWLLIHSI